MALFVIIFKNITLYNKYWTGRIYATNQITFVIWNMKQIVQRFHADGSRNIRDYYADTVSCLSINTNVTWYFHPDINYMTMLWFVALSSVMNV